MDCHRLNRARSQSKAGERGKRTNRPRNRKDLDESTRESEKTRRSAYYRTDGAINCRSGQAHYNFYDWSFSLPEVLMRIPICKEHILSRSRSLKQIRQKYPLRLNPRLDTILQKRIDVRRILYNIASFFFFFFFFFNSSTCGILKFQG